MSEYQYYEFQAIDRHLTPAEMQELRKYSSRAEITASRFVNEYNWGDFKGNADAWMGKYFDAFLYFANWGTRTIKLRLPAQLLEARIARDYCDGHNLALRAKGKNIILTFHRDTEGDGDDANDLDGADMLASLIPMRAELARGDLRALYLGWLVIAQGGDLDDEAVEPPVPPGLGRLSGSLDALVDFMDIDPDLLEVAAQASAAPSAEPTADQIARWIARLPAAEKDRVLTKLVAEPEDRSALVDLVYRLRQAHRSDSSAALESRRTVGTLFRTAELKRTGREQTAARKAAEAKARADRDAAVARARHLDRLANQETRLWADIERLIATKLPKNYDLAVQHLTDLRDLASRETGTKTADFAGRLAVLRAAHVRKPSLLERFTRAGL